MRTHPIISRALPILTKIGCAEAVRPPLSDPVIVDARAKTRPGTSICCAAKRSSLVLGAARRGVARGDGVARGEAELLRPRRSAAVGDGVARGEAELLRPRRGPAVACRRHYGAGISSLVRDSLLFFGCGFRCAVVNDWWLRSVLFLILCFVATKKTLKPPGNQESPMSYHHPRDLW